MPYPGSGAIGFARVATLRYDYRNQLVEYHDQDYAGAERVHRFAYDVLGRRVMKITDHNCVAFATIEKRFVYGGPPEAPTGRWQILAEHRSTPPRA